MLNLKKTAVAVLALSSSAVFAGTMGPVCTPGSVTTPCENTAWDFGAQALYLQPTFSNDFAYAGYHENANHHRHYVEFDPKWGWGFQIEGSYHFNTGNDIDLNWYHYSKSTNRDLVSDLEVVGKEYEFSAKPQWDAVNFEFGQHVDFGEFKSIRFHTGAQYARLKITATERYDHPVGVESKYVESLTSTFNGFGPRAGADASYGFGNGFAVYGKAGAAVLVGSSKFSGGDHDASDNYSAGGSRTSIVPELEAKLGATYTYAMAQGDVTLDAGYMWFDYLNGPNQGLLFNTNSIGSTDFGMTGVYAGAKWVGNIA